MTPFDPTFNGGKPVVSPADIPSQYDHMPTPTTQNSASAVAVQGDGKIVVVGTILPPTDATFTPKLAVRRYNADGSVDSTFGTAGETDVTLPDGSSDLVIASSNVLIDAAGNIVFSADLATANATTFYQPNSLDYTSDETVVARLTATGAPDATFGTGGTVAISTDAAEFRHLALQADGKILLGGQVTLPRETDQVVALTRLNADGSTDSTFNGGKFITLENYNAATSHNDAVAVLVTPGQKIVLVRNDPIVISGGTGGPGYQVFEFNADGTFNTAFGGIGFVTGAAHQTANAATLQADGKIVMAGSQVFRLNTDGSVDTNFKLPTFTDFIPSSVAVQPDGKIIVGGQGRAYSATRAFGVVRLASNGVTDGSFGPGGEIPFSSARPASLSSGGTSIQSAIGGVAVTPAGRFAAVGTVTYERHGPNTFNSFDGTQTVVAEFRASTPVAGDYDGDGHSDIAAELTGLAQFAIRRSAGGDLVQPFGIAGIAQTIPDPGDYDGDGKTDVAAYLPAYGLFAYRPSSGGSDVVVRFGTPGTNAGATIPTPGDYDGDGKTDIAVYLPASGSFAYRPSSGGADRILPFGIAGPGASIPAPGDYDGDGRTDLAVYLPSLATLAYRPSAGGSDVLTYFGSAGAGASIPVPGDYNGDGMTDIAVYLPASGSFAVLPSNFGGSSTPYVIQFGAAGAYRSVPAPGDYDGDGRTDLAVYLPALGQFAYRPSSGGADVIQGFGAVGFTPTVSATSIPSAIGYIVLDDGSPTQSATARKKSAVGLA